LVVCQNKAGARFGARPLAEMQRGSALRVCLPNASARHILLA
jgi:hypothetical protein